MSKRRITARQRAMIRRLIAKDNPWTGPVERRKPAMYQEKSILLTWRCRNPWCGQWTMNGAHLSGRCNFCQHRRDV